ncbi:MAG: tRNA (adenosine(37)-N6)-threonylcarbamoyltransferase complex dimerization subunit type 1 TsaB [Sphingobacteriales bacterium UTBCD1]|jgi:tRNA threonylcarbamoyladenosine biosynthesis protein TsaB|nr:MAG: tRNA (adenosine(37)-N6)-threonylcarbamoyltransferase complex dimerization subunit type 1 TsaB [Sphingobacteriales bacterium UTBCD1]
MAIILNIDTALETASVCLSQDGKAVITSVNKEQKDHASWLQPAIVHLMKESGYKLNVLNAIAVSIGPGSYTGMRVGLSSAKGLCYALNIPLITVSTLVMMAHAARNEEADLLCPMIDARRMEVFTAVYTRSLKEFVKPQALVLNAGVFSELLSSHEILFFGSGSKKFISLLNHDNAFFKDVNFDASDLSSIATEKFIAHRFADLAYSEPEYLKEFFSPVRKQTM